MLHNYRKIENFMENLKIQNYPFFKIFDDYCVKVILDDNYMECL